MWGDTGMTDGARPLRGRGQSSDGWHWQVHFLYEGSSIVTKLDSKFYRIRKRKYFFYAEQVGKDRQNTGIFWEKK